MTRCILALIGTAAVAWAAQPTLTTITTLPGGTEETPFVIDYAMVHDASNASGNTTRFKVTSLARGYLSQRAHGTGDPWVAISSFPIFLTNSVDLQWVPPANLYGDKGAIYVLANDGLGDAASNNSSDPILVLVNLANTPDPIAAASGVNARSGTVGPFTPPMVAATEDTWNAFTYDSLCLLLQVDNPDDSPLDLTITDLGIGTFSTSNGGPAIGTGTVITTGGTLWWLPPANRFTAVGATPADDEPPVFLASFSIRKTADHAVKAGTVSLSTAIANLIDPFDTAATGAKAFKLTRDGAPLDLSVPALLAHLTGHANYDRTDSVRILVTDPRFTSWQFDADGNFVTSLDFTAIATDTVRLRIYADPAPPPGTYTIGTWHASDPGSSDVTADFDLVVNVVDGSGGSSGSGGGGGGGGGCGAGAGLAIGLIALGLLGLRPGRPQQA